MLKPLTYKVAMHVNDLVPILSQLFGFEEDKVLSLLVDATGDAEPRGVYVLYLDDEDFEEATLEEYDQTYFDYYHMMHCFRDEYGLEDEEIYVEFDV